MKTVSRGRRSSPLASQAAALLDSGHPEEALRICDAALARGGRTPQLLGNRALALEALARFEEALQDLRQVEAQLPRDYAVLVNTGNVLRDLGRLEESRRYLEDAIALQPDRSSAHYNLALTLLLGGDYRRGFAEYEWRWGTRHFTKGPAFSQPAWDGSELAGRRILLHAEQGAGDAIQFARYAAIARDRGGQVILAVPPALVRLMSWLEGCEVVSQAVTPTPFEEQCPLLSLAHAVRTDLASIPPPARFCIPEDIRRKWAGLLGEKRGRRIGLVWAGDPVHRHDNCRSLPCELLQPLMDLPGVEWFSLQVGASAGRLAGARDLAPELTDYAETAAAIAALDLVIAVDTSVAHLAGSLGVPVWMLSRFAGDWRWLLGRSDSPWYPSMRLFRQQAPREWEPVTRAIAQELREPAPAVHTDTARWSNPANLEPAWDDRATQAAGFLPAGATVMDLGCGRMSLERALPPGCRYVPCDLVARDDRTLLCDFNRQPVPKPAGVTHIAALGVLEYLQEPRAFLGQLREFGVPVVLSYCPTDFTGHLDRRALGWINHLSLRELTEELSAAGFHLQSCLQPDSNQVLLRATPAEARLAVRKRVLVMSYNNCGNFGDRLGFHVLSSLMPAAAEVHFGDFRPWHVPEGDFDLLVLGLGNSIFHPILTAPLLDLVRRIPRTVGIFGTQYREAIDARRMAKLLDRLTVWFARTEEDLLLYGSGRPNAVHLGDWLISGFPLTRWTRDETLRVGAEIWNDLPLDRTIQTIQSYRNVISERIHPLLCALTSAERVAYLEQREDGSGRESGKFRSLLIDVFGRTWPESVAFEFPREAVAAYRARVLRVMSGMPGLFERLLDAS